VRVEQSMTTFWKEERQGHNIYQNEQNLFFWAGPPPIPLIFYFSYFGCQGIWQEYTIEIRTLWANYIQRQPYYYFLFVFSIYHCITILLQFSRLRHVWGYSHNVSFSGSHFHVLNRLQFFLLPKSILGIS